MMNTTADADFWDRLAEKYAAQPVKDLTAFERKQAITRGLLSPDHRVFEIGCGTGSLSLAMAPDATEIHAMDLSAEMVRIARGKAEDRGVENVTFHVGTLSDLPKSDLPKSDLPKSDLLKGAAFEPGTFDHAWAYSILHLVEDLPDTLRRLHDLLAPGGHLVSSTVCLRDSWVPYAALIGVMRWFGKAPRVVANLDRATLTRAMGDAGFVDVTEHDVKSDPMVAFITARRAL